MRGTGILRAGAAQFLRKVMTVSEATRTTRTLTFASLQRGLCRAIPCVSDRADLSAITELGEYRLPPPHVDGS